MTFCVIEKKTEWYDLYSRNVLGAKASTPQTARKTTIRIVGDFIAQVTIREIGNL